MRENLGGGSSFLGNLVGGLGLLLVDVPDGKGSKSLHQTSSVVASRGVSESKHGLRKFSVEFCLGVAEGRFNVDKLLEVVEASVHGYCLACSSKVVHGSVRKLDSWGRGREFGRSRSPFDGGTLVKKVSGDEVSNTLLLDAVDLEGLLVLGVEVGGEDFDDHIGKLLLGVNEGIEVGLSGFDGGHDGLQGMSTLFHVTLDLPVKLDIGGNVKVKAEVKKFKNTGVVHGVKTLENDDRGGLDGFRSVKSTVDVVVNGLGDGLSFLERLDLFVHQVEVVLKGVQGGQTSHLTSISVVQVVVVKANDGGEVGNQSVSLPSSLSKSSTKRTNNISSEDAGEAAHESGLSAARVSGNTDNNGGLSVLQRHLKATGRRGSSNISRHKCRRGEGGNRAEGQSGKSDLHGIAFFRPNEFMRTAIVLLSLCFTCIARRPTTCVFRVRRERNEPEMRVLLRA